MFRGLPLAVVALAFAATPTRAMEKFMDGANGHCLLCDVFKWERRSDADDAAWRNAAPRGREAYNWPDPRLHDPPASATLRAQ